MLIIRFEKDNTKISAVKVTATSGGHVKIIKSAKIELPSGEITQTQMDINHIAVLINQLLKRNDMPDRQAICVLTEPLLAETRIEQVKRVFHMLGITLSEIRNDPCSEATAESLMAEYVARTREEKEKLSLWQSLFQHKTPECVTPNTYNIPAYKFWCPDFPNKQAIDEMNADCLHDLLNSLETADIFTFDSFGKWTYEKPVTPGMSRHAESDEKEAIRTYAAMLYEDIANVPNEPELPVEPYSETAFEWQSVKNKPLPDKTGVYLLTVEQMRNGDCHRFTTVGTLTSNPIYPNGWQICTFDPPEVYQELRTEKPDGYDRIIAWATKPMPFTA